MLSFQEWPCRKIVEKLIDASDPSICPVAQCAVWTVRWPYSQNGPVYATGPYHVAHVVDTGPYLCPCSRHGAIIMPLCPLQGYHIRINQKL